MGKGGQAIVVSRIEVGARADQVTHNIRMSVPRRPDQRGTAVLVGLVRICAAFDQAGDNIFMYWFVVFGWAAFPAFLLILLKSLRLRPFRSEVELRVYALLLAMLAYGAMTNIVENAVFALVCGMVIRWLCSTPQRQIEIVAYSERQCREYAR